MGQHHSGHSYHDYSDWPHLELGPSDDRRYVEQLFKAIFQAGLSWPVVESHWPAFSEVFQEEIDDLQRRFPGLGDFSAWWFMQSVGLPVPLTG
jgi:3-methyladenine DNA glycosylase Tag